MKLLVKEFHLTLSLIVSLVLFLGGIWILSLRIPVWSLLLGVAAAQIGIILIIFVFDSLSTPNLEKKYHIVSCQICGDPTNVPLGETQGLCPTCRKDESIISSLSKISLFPRR